MLEEKWNIFVGPTGAYFIILHELDRFNLECSLWKGSAEGVCVCESVCVFAPTYACMQAHAHTHMHVCERTDTAKQRPLSELVTNAHADTHSKTNTANLLVDRLPKGA